MSAIRDLSLSIGQGEILAVVGESGCGKSVLCKTVMGLLPRPAEITGGSIWLKRRESRAGDDATGDRLDLVSLTEKEFTQLRGCDISMVFQDPMTSLDPACPVGAQIAEAIRVHEPKVSKAEARRRVVELLETVGIDRADQRYDSYPWMLSGGMRQRCVLAMAMAKGSGLLIADEPTTALDVTVQNEILELLQRLRREQGLSILFISHDLGVVSKIADRVAIMYAGRIVEIGTTEEVLSHAVHPYTWGLIHALPAFAHEGKLRPIPGVPPTLPEGFEGDAFAARNAWALGIDYLQAPPFFEITPTHRAATWLADPRAPKVDYHADARAADAAREAKAGQAADGQFAVNAGESTDDTPILEVQNVSHVFRLGRHTRVKAVENVSFDIRRGELFALVGESGSGKTTLARCVLGWYPPAAGQILYDGIDITGWCSDFGLNGKNKGPRARLTREQRNRLSREIQFISQDPGAALDPRMTVRELIAEPLKIHGIYTGRRQREEYIDGMLQEVQLDASVLDRVPTQLSGGQKQRVSIARAFSMNPRLLVADEPLASLDVSIQAQIVELLLSMQQRHGSSILFISHDLSMVELIADRVGVMCRGHLVETGSSEELFKSPKHDYTKSLLASIPVPHMTGEEVRR